MSITHCQVLATTLVNAGVALACWMGGAAPASADPNSAGAEPNPFGGLSCDCPTTAPVGGGTGRDALDRGFRSGLAGH